MEADFAAKMMDQVTDVQVEQELLKDLSARFQEQGSRNLQHYGLPEPRSLRNEVEHERSQYDKVESMKTVEHWKNLFTPEQRKFIDTVLRAIFEPRDEPKFFFLNGGSGRGKTEVSFIGFM